MKDIVNLRIHIAPVGFELDRIILPAVRMKADKVWLIAHDNTVLQTESGAAFMTGFNQFYYSFSPMIADYERENPAFKEAVKLTITPLLISLTLLQHADIDSEHEMLVYGIAVILLNIGMYFVAPAVLITKIRSFYKLQ